MSSTSYSFQRSLVLKANAQYSFEGGFGVPRYHRSARAGATGYVDVSVLYSRPGVGLFGGRRFGQISRGVGSRAKSSNFVFFFVFFNLSSFYASKSRERTARPVLGESKKPSGNPKSTLFNSTRAN